MTPVDTPFQHPAHAIAGAWRALPSWLPVPGLGALAVNAFLLKGREPLLVDTGLAALSEDFLARLAEEIDLEDLRWIWLSHTDADHIGNLDRLLARAPKARVVTSFLGAGKMGLMGAGDPDRLRLLEPGEVFEVGGRRLRQVKPPYYDAPETMGFFDETDRVLFTADAFGALLGGAVGAIEEIGAGDLRDGLVAWSSVDAPWLARMDRGALGATLRALDRLDPAFVLSGHLPVARDIRALTGILATACGRGVTAAITPETVAQVEAILA
ncbi:MBL fold metallo-hydrolase [Amaricoccus solimangrovi]|uniref:MBL fold metallo-hydrolase n=1 Tax=Amaricoccus solimangrovi TaxID=2589815 RepID=A0A501WKM6_9RHOB|nr:MBL fold metallo-hydrolase [Amaricoccus solimangrovi]TPE48985.1 MBL fold metallo-hydrolase [Amaricoccus solimangrovi]